MWAAWFSVALLALAFVAGQNEQLGAWLSATPEQVFSQHQYWRAWTTLAVHADFEHFLSNIGYFAGLAFLLRGYYGPWAFPILSLLAGGVINLIALGTYPAETQLVGASGVVYFMAAFWLMVYVFTERSSDLVRRLANAAAFILILLMPQTFEARVSYRTHFIGLGLGFLVGAVFFYFERDKIRAHEVWEPVRIHGDEDWSDWRGPSWPAVQAFQTAPDSGGGPPQSLGMPELLPPVQLAPARLSVLDADSAQGQGKLN